MPVRATWQAEKESKFRDLLDAFIKNSPWGSLTASNETPNRYFSELWNFIGPDISRWISDYFFEQEIWLHVPKAIDMDLQGDRYFLDDDSRKLLVGVFTEFVKGLPHKYVVNFCMRSSAAFTYNLSKTSRIGNLDLDDKDLSNYQGSSFNGIGIPPFALSVDVFGYSTGNYYDTAIQSALSFAKKLVYLSSVLGTGMSYRKFSLTRKVPLVLLTDVRRKETKELVLPMDFLRYLREFTILNNSDGLEQMSAIAEALGSTKNHEFTPLGNGAEWAFEAGAAFDERHALVSTSIAVESLLGYMEAAGEADRGREGPISFRLADRISFVVGQTRKERAQIYQQFLDFYALRSRLVHGRTSKLDTAADKELFKRGKVLVEQAFLQELIRYLATERVVKRMRARSTSD